MAHTKIISPSGWDFDRHAVVEIPYSSRGLIGNDRADFLKYASHDFVDFLDEVRPQRDEHPIHILSHGATEFYGPNRNGDGFKEATCRRYHKTFEKLARIYRNHKNKDPRISFGIIKKAAYNERMKRVELLGFLNKEKSAADRNGGFVADKEMEKLARGDDLATSMACRVPYDVCSWCQNKARTRDEYCKEASCAAGGCKDNLTRLVKMGRDLHHLHVDNPHPAWFDSSVVWKPADRIAYANTADYLTKAAADLFDGNYGAPGWKVAADLGVTPGYDVVAYQEAELAEFGPAVACQVKLAAALEGAARYGPLPAPEYRRAFGPAFRGRVAGGEFGEPGTAKFAAALGCLADDGAVLPVEDFAALTKRAGDAAAARSRLPGVYGRMLSDGTLSQKLAASPYRCDAAGPPAPAHRRAAAGVAKWASLDREAVSRRCVISSVRGEPVPPLETGFEGEKQAADGSAAEALARDYACYTLSALHRIAGAGGDFVLTAGLSVLQNHVK